MMAHTPTNDHPLGPADPQGPAAHGHTPGGGFGPPGPTRVQARRDVFWQNVVRESLMALAAMAASSSGRLSPTPSAARSSPKPVADLLDGRMGVITTLGQRIPIADVVPLFACSTAGTEEDRARSGDVQCTVFQIKTPAGEAYTLPLSQIVGVHALSLEMASQLEEAAEALEEKDAQGNRLPFGFAAYTSLTRAETENKGSESPS